MKTRHWMTALAALASACGNSTNTPPDADAATTPSADAAAGLDAAPRDGGSQADAEPVDGGTSPKPPDLNNVPAAVPAVLSWGERSPCDSVEIERQDMVNPFPPNPQFSVPAPMMTFTDTTAAMSGNTYFWRARCVAGGLRSIYSNEVAWVHP